MSDPVAWKEPQPMSELVATTPATSGLTTSDEIGELAKALAAARKDFRPVLKDASNPFFRSKYADLAGVIESTSEALSKNGLVVIQSPRLKESRVSVTTLLAHSSGQWLRDELELPLSKFDAQGAGSAITYARRYAYQAIVGVAAEDEDGNAASQKFEKQGDGTFAKSDPKPPAEQPKRGRLSKKAEASDYQPWAGLAGKPEEPKTATTPGSPVQESPASTSNGQNIHGLVIEDSEIEFPGDNVGEKAPNPVLGGKAPEPARVPNAEERIDFMDRLIKLKNAGYTGIREWLLKESGETITNNIPFARMSELVDRLEAAEKSGTLKDVLK